MATDVPTIAGIEQLRLLASGASADVYVGRDSELSRTVAVKVLRFDLRDREIRARFQRECALIGPLSRHPHIVTVYRPGTASDGRPFLAMEDCSAHGSLQAEIDRHGALPADEVIRIGIKLCGALESAHRTGVIHGDVKPANVLITEFGEPALADFGVGALEHEAGTAEFGFSPEYAAPEVLQTGRSASRATDIYALAATLWTLLEGRPPFERAPGETRLAFALRVSSSDLPPLSRRDVPPGLESALAAGLAKAPGDRPQRALDFADRLGAVERSLGLTPTAPIAAAATVPDTAHTDAVDPLYRAEVVEEEADGPVRALWRRPAVLLPLAGVLLLLGTLIGIGEAGRSHSATASGPPSPTISGSGASPTPTPQPSGPAPPTMAAPLVGRQTVTVQWRPAAGTQPVGYVLVWRAQLSKQTHPITEGGNVTRATIAGLRPATTRYCFVVAAYYAQTGETNPSSAVCSTLYHAPRRSKRG